MTALRDPFTLRALKNLNQDELISLCSRLIQIPSDNPPGFTKVAADYIKVYLSDAGIESTLHETKPGIVSLMSTIGEGSPHLILNGHIDQFPAEVGEKWSFDPYSGEVKNGKILGRGSGDMKGGLSSLIYCFKEAASLNLPGKITLTCTADEETGGKWGAFWLLTHYPELHGDGVLSGEPSGLTVRIGEKGMMPLNITTTGKAAHGSFSGYAGANAISKMARIIPIVESFNAYVPQFKIDSQRILKLVDAGYTAQFGHEGKGLSSVLKEVTVNTGVIKGGVKSNIVPAHCEAEVDIRLPLDTNPIEIQNSIEMKVKTIDPTAYLQFPKDEQMVPEATYSNIDSGLVQSLNKAAGEVLGSTPLFSFTSGCTDCRFWRRLNIAAAAFGPKVYSMGGIDEHILMTELVKTAEVHLSTIIRFLKNI